LVEADVLRPPRRHLHSVGTRRLAVAEEDGDLHVRVLVGRVQQADRLVAGALPAVAPARQARLRQRPTHVPDPPTHRTPLPGPSPHQPPALYANRAPAAGTPFARLHPQAHPRHFDGGSAMVSATVPQTRSPQSPQRITHRGQSSVNLGSLERLFSLVGGGAL